MKVQLQREKETWNAPGRILRPITFALPYFRTPYGTYIHRVRSGAMHEWDGELSHVHFRFWCGGAGFAQHRVGRKVRPGELFAQAPEGAILCATCEGRAIGAGMEGSHKINGRMVRFSPRA